MYAAVTLIAAWCGSPPIAAHAGRRSSVRLAEGAYCEEYVHSLPLPPNEAPPEVFVEYAMAALRKNDDPRPDTGKLTNWALGSDMVRGIHGGDPLQFLRWTRTSPVFDCMVDCESFELEMDTLSTIPGTPTRGAICKVVVRVTPREVTVDGPHSVRGRIGKPPERRFRWTMQQQRRPPRIGAWLIYEVLSMDHALDEV